MESHGNNPNAIVNYQRAYEKTVSALSMRPSLLLHVCCGPCSCYPLTELCQHFDVTIYYANSNIYPAREYAHRLATLKELLTYLKRDYGYDVKLIVPPYENEAYTRKLAPLKDCPEGGERCFLCYRLRLEEGYAYAEENGYDYFTTVMTVSRQKNSQKLNAIGAELEAKYPRTHYLYSDFKKKRGLEIGTEIRKKYDLYNQDYCGCVYSYEEALERRKRNQGQSPEE